MTIDLSRRQSLKLMAGGGLLSVMPMTALSASESKHVFIISQAGQAGDAFGHAINQNIKEPMHLNNIRIDHKRYESIMSLAFLPQGSLLLGLVNEAEKVLIDSVLRDRQGLIKTTARIKQRDSVDSAAMIADATISSALATSNNEYSEELQDSEISSPSLISFYAYL